MLIKDVTKEQICEYMKLDYCELDVEEVVVLDAAIDAAFQYIINYTGISKEKIENMHDMTLAYLCLVQDMYDNRTLQIEKNTLNKTIQTILDMHCENLL
ncbi:MAG: head-tail connector protein [Lachnospiraceae bacterium]